MRDARPDPIALLRVNEDLGATTRGRLKIFFGAAPGVGKTYAMLETARRDFADGVDIVIGYVEEHKRPETSALLEGLPTLPRKHIEHRDIQLEEFDFEAALKRHPTLIVVDEFAHTNALGSIHEKRWQDIDALVRAGINVYTTLNVQHLETLNDVVAKITGVSVRETIPDVVFDRAWEVELVDIAPDDLLARIKAGKVYLPSRVEDAKNGFFKRTNLIALRELALRRMTERLDKQLDHYRKAQTISGIWPVRDKLLVCVGPSPLSVKLVRATYRMAVALRCNWVAVHVDLPSLGFLSADGQARVTRNLQVAERLGADIAVVSGHDMVETVLRTAQERNVTRIIVGKPSQPRWREWLRGSFVYSLTRQCGDIDVYVISGDSAPESTTPSFVKPDFEFLNYFAAVVVVATCTLVNWALFAYVDPVNLVMVYLLGVMAVAVRYHRGAATCAAFLSVALFDFLFVPPFWTFAVENTQYLFTFAVMLTAALIISTLTIRLRSQTSAAFSREARARALYEFTKELTQLYSLSDIYNAAVERLSQIFGSELCIVEASPSGGLKEKEAASNGLRLDVQTRAVASWALEHQEAAGESTSVLAASNSTFYPIGILDQRFGVLGIRKKAPQNMWTQEKAQLIDAFCYLIGAAISRVRLSEQAQKAELEIAGERMRNTLLSGVSHELRTPLAVIEGASTTLLQGNDRVTPEVRQSLLETVVAESEHLNRLVGNLLDATRLEAGAVILNKEWQSFEELIGSVLNRLQWLLHGRKVEIRLEAELPLIHADGLLLHQVLINLVENAAKFSGAETIIEIEGCAVERGLQLKVLDRGVGVREEDLSLLFEKFYQGQSLPGRKGTGLGLSISRDIVKLHGGTIKAENRIDGGTVFTIFLPCNEIPPTIDKEEPNE